MTERISGERRAAIRERCDRATIGPWDYGIGYYPASAVPFREAPVRSVFSDGVSFDVCYMQNLTDAGQSRADAIFIAAARADLPMLLDALDAAEQRIADLETENGTLRAGLKEIGRVILDRDEE